MDTTRSGSSAAVLAPTLDRWTALDWSNGVQVPHLSPHDPIIVSTRNSTYEIIVLVPHTVLVMVRGGQFFPEFTPAFVAGSSLGGGLSQAARYLRRVSNGVRDRRSTDRDHEDG